MTDSSILHFSSPVESHIFLTNTALVLTLINQDGSIRMRDLAGKVGITEQAVQGIVDHLILEGYLVVNRSDARHTYEVRKDRVLGFPFNDCPLGELLALCERQD